MLASLLCFNIIYFHTFCHINLFPPFLRLYIFIYELYVFILPHFFCDFTKQYSRLHIDHKGRCPNIKKIFTSHSLMS
jgi:hypothetical protein